MGTEKVHTKSTQNQTFWEFKLENEQKGTSQRVLETLERSFYMNSLIKTGFLKRTVTFSKNQKEDFFHTTSTFPVLPIFE